MSTFHFRHPYSHPSSSFQECVWPGRAGGTSFCLPHSPCSIPSPPFPHHRNLCHTPPLRSGGCPASYIRNGGSSTPLSLRLSPPGTLLPPLHTPLRHLFTDILTASNRITASSVSACIGSSSSSGGGYALRIPRLALFHNGFVSAAGAAAAAAAYSAAAAAQTTLRMARLHMPHDLALAPPWVLDLLRRQQQFLLQMSLPNWVPTYPWSTLQALYRSTVSWMPSLPGTRALHVQLLGALNIAGSGAQVLRTSVAACLEFFLTTRRAQAQGFEMALPAGYQAALQASAGPWYRTAIISMANCAMHMSRVLFLLALFAPVLMFAPVALSWNMGRLEWMTLLRRTLECAGPAFIKWGQWAATRHDIFPPDFCAELEMLHTQAPAHKFKHTARTIESALGMSVVELFEYIDARPVASGSIGQIHRARLSQKGATLTGFPAGQVVAVKVRHPGVADTILRDFSLMMAVASLASQVPAIAHLRIEDTLKQFAAPLTEQVDLSREASNLQQFNYNFRNTLAVDFPVPLYPLVSNEVLVETFEEGDNISRYIASGHGPINQRLSVIGSGTMLQMMLLDNLIHSDLHPGNILVRLMPPGSLMGLLYGGLEGVKRSGYVTNQTRAQIDVLQQRWLQPQIVLLDVGMATELSDEDRSNMVGLFKSFAAMDGTEVGKWVLRFSGPDQHCPAPDDFISAMEGVFNDLRNAENSNGSTSANSAETLSYVLEMVRQHKVTMPGHICAVVVTTLVLEGWSNKLDPSHSVLVQVQKMFGNQTLPLGKRLLRAVDEVMNGGEEGILAMS